MSHAAVISTASQTQDQVTYPRLAPIIRNTDTCEKLFDDVYIAEEVIIPRNISALIFDVDGTLCFDSERLRRAACRGGEFNGVPILDAFTHLFNGSGVFFQKEIRSIEGRFFGALTEPELYEHIFDHCGNAFPKVLSENPGITKELFVQQCRRLFTEALLNNNIEAFKGATQLIEGAKENGMKVATCSNAGRGWGESLLRCLNLLHHFDYTHFCDDPGFKGQRPKPSPDPYFYTTQKLEASSHETWAFEDAIEGALAAYQADLTVVVCPGASPKWHNRPEEFIDELLGKLRIGNCRSDPRADQKPHRNKILIVKNDWTQVILT